jgi:hypothetical protein
MARHSYNIANATGAQVRADLNNALAAIRSVNSGSGTPSSTVAYQYFIDDSVTPALIKQRNAGDNGDILLGEVGGQAYFANGTQSKPSISFRNDTDLGFRRNDANKLSIVTGGSDRVTVDAAGNVGIGVVVPGANLHVQNTPDCTVQITSGTSGDSTIRLGDTGDANIGRIKYFNSSNSLAFDTNDVTRITILSDGKCGIGTTTPNERLHVAGNIETTGNIFNASPAIGTSGFNLRSGASHQLGRDTADGNDVLEVFGGSGEARVKGDGDLQNTNNSYGAISDSKLKENIVDAGSQWDDIKDVRVRNYNFKSSTGYGTHTQIGVIAQEIEAVSPGLVKESNDKDADGNSLGTTTKTVSYSVLYMKAIKALQEAMDRIETLEAKVAALEAGN